MSFEYTKTDVILKVKDVCLSFYDKSKNENTQILKDVNVEIKDVVRPGMYQGQVVGFLAPSGMGKTLLFEIIAGLRKPTSGQVLLGNPLTPVKTGRVGVVQQNYPLFTYRTVYNNLMVAANNGLIPKEQRKEAVMNILNSFGLSKHNNRYPSELSGGQRQRVAIAQQMLCSEHFLLLDEPFSGLDLLMIEKVLNMLRSISTLHELNTIIIVSHDIVSTASIADTLWVMGRDRDKEGNPIQGARIKHEYDLMAMDLAWRKGIETEPKFNYLIKEVRAVFPTL